MYACSVNLVKRKYEVLLPERMSHSSVGELRISLRSLKETHNTLGHKITRIEKELIKRTTKTIERQTPRTKRIEDKVPLPKPIVATTKK